MLLLLRRRIKTAAIIAIIATAAPATIPPIAPGASPLLLAEEPIALGPPFSDSPAPRGEVVVGRLTPVPAPAAGLRTVGSPVSNSQYIS